MKVNELKSYEIIEEREITDLKSMSYLLRHKKTGARIAVLSNDDENKVFYIGFRTPPTDSTGVAHIVEHTVLCGSKDFPAKDPFIELAKGSLNTFLNAMTYPDKTVYPIASCNDQDFQNLMNVYLDAVFYPNIYKEEKIFKQEGWHYELNNPEDELTLNGVVYSEMKGAFSSPDGVFEREIMNSLYPDVTYGVESGGDPDVIPSLTYGNFLDFHKRYYHPSNSYIYLYGNMDVAEKLAWIDEKYLSSFDELKIDSTIGKQEAFKEIRNVHKDYPVAEGESLKDNTYLSYNTVIGDTLDKELYVAFQMIDYAVCSAQGAPLKQALLDANVGKDVYGFFENGIAQPYFSVVAKNSEAENKEKFISIIEEVFTKLVNEGIDKRSLEAALNYFEFRYREADFDHYPKGLMYGLQVLDSWLYEDSKPFIHIEANATFASLREKINTDYYEKLIKTYILDNTHKSIVMVTPKEGLVAEKEAALAAKLKAYKDSLSEDEIKKIVEETKALKQYQEEESREEDLAKIPMLKRSDMKKEAEPIINEMREKDGNKVLFHDIFTNGINYVRLVFDISDVPEELLQYVGLLRLFLGSVDTKNYSYKDLFNEINIQSGGIVPLINVYSDAAVEGKYCMTFDVKAKTLYQKTDKTLELMKEIMFFSDFTDKKHLLELIQESKSKMQASMMSAGHGTASVRAMSYFSEIAELSERLNGIEHFRFLEDLEKHFDERFDELIEGLNKALKFVFRKDNLMYDVTADEEGYEIFASLIGDMTGNMFDKTYESNKLEIIPVKKNEGFMTSAQIHYVATAGNFVKKGLAYTGALKVLKVIMGYDYLWNQVRVLGGAYGCMSNFQRTGDCYFVSYRDPNMTKTLEVFAKAADYVRNLKLNERDLTKYIIGAVSSADTPLNPSAKGARSLNAYLSNVTYELLQKERDELLNVTESEVNRLADYIDAFVSFEDICVVGNEKTLKDNKDIFMTVEPLFH